MRQTRNLLTLLLLIQTTGTAFTQAKKDTLCTYQPPRISCELAQKNAEAIYKYPLALKSLSEKDSIIKTSDSEKKNLRNGFEEERKEFNFKIKGLTDTNKGLTTQLDIQIGRKKNWRLVAGVAVMVVIIDRLTK